MISGLDAAENHAIPLPEVTEGYVPRLDAVTMTRPVGLTRFHELYGLVPSPPEEGPAASSMAEQLEARCTQRVEHARRMGQAYFKQATIEQRDARTGRFVTCEDCSDKLARATQELRVVRDLDPHDYLATLMMVHLLLEQDKPTAATSMLMLAFNRQPDLLARDAGAGFDDFFGDVREPGGHSALLTSQMRRYRRIGALNQAKPEAKALEAYCAWRLGELAEARQALDQLEQLALRNTKGGDDFLNYAAALRNTLQ
jgi:hypothetical protein